MKSHRAVNFHVTLSDVIISAPIEDLRDCSWVTLEGSHNNAEINEYWHSVL